MLPDDSSPHDEKKPDLAPPDETAVPSPEASPEAKSSRRKPVEHKDAKDHHHKIKLLKTEIDELKKRVEAGEKEAEALRNEAGEARKDAADWKDRTLRTLAETDNLRKRLEREKTEYFQFALADALKDFLLVIDNLERAMKAHDAPLEFREGIDLIIKQMRDLLTKRGVTPIVCADGKFDPSFHQALLTEESDGIEEPMIGEELQKGYLLNDRLLRPTLVKVLLPRTK